jgi:hypothetical protein
VRVFVHRHSRHGRDSSAFRKLIGRNELITDTLLSHATDQNSEPLQAECSIRSNLMAAVLRKLGFKTRIVYLFDTDGKDGDKLRSHTFVDVLNPAMEEWESHDPDYNFCWQSKITSKRISVAEEAEAVSSIEPCSEIRCGWDLVSDEGRLGLTDIVSTVDKLTDERISRVTSRANLNKTFTFYGRTGPFCEVIKRLGVRIEPAAPARRG